METSQQRVKDGKIKGSMVLSIPAYGLILLRSRTLSSEVAVTLDEM